MADDEIHEAVLGDVASYDGDETVETFTKVPNHLVGLSGYVRENGRHRADDGCAAMNAGNSQGETVGFIFAP